MICVRFKRLHPDARQPVRASAAAACFDLHALHGADTRSGSLHRVGTGLAVELPPGFVMLLFPRSGLAVNHGLRLANCVGVVDADYRGEVSIAIKSEPRSDHEPSTSYRINPGDRVGQAMVLRLPDVMWEESEGLGWTERGAGGFGSTGVQGVALETPAYEPEADPLPDLAWPEPGDAVDPVASMNAATDQAWMDVFTFSGHGKAIGAEPTELW